MDWHRAILWMGGLLAGTLVLIAAPAAAGPRAYRWVDDQGAVNYAGSLDEVPEPYRSQFVTREQAPAPRPVAPPRAPVASPAAPAPPPPVLPPLSAPSVSSPAVSRPASPDPAPQPPRRRGWWVVTTPEGYWRTIDEERCQRIADSAATRFKRDYRCVFESYD